MSSISRVVISVFIFSLVKVRVKVHWHYRITTMIPFMGSILMPVRRVGCSPDRRIQFFADAGLGVRPHTGPRGNRNAERSIQSRVDMSFPTITPGSISCAVIALFCVLVASCAGPARQPSVSSVATGRYGHTLHNRFYEAWQQPRAVGLPPGKISVPVDVTIDSGGRIVDFRIVKSSGNSRIDKSIAAVGKKVTQVASPPGAKAGKLFKLRIYFELDVLS